MIVTGFEIGIGIIFSLIFIFCLFFLTICLWSYYKDCKYRKFYYKLNKEKPTTREPL